ncbi:hypothetical protein [Thalassovita aquimarina]|uniref:Uncharacterized protein n=1 Tax=Thalassovita aquimarina TaxID=2785917 RepID=A0ABS5HQ32_9RHOB|nr:hypothetical protein [Thalassovita aquimarina]MBR9651081.1 hypothetical protein [Thalassovita aquimarina]
MDKQKRRERLRPFKLALAFTAAGELTYFLGWGLWLYPAGNVLLKLAWTVTCAIAMAVAVGVVVTVWRARKPDRLTTWIGTAFLYALILSICTMICYIMDSRFDYFGGASAPTLFVTAGLLPAFLSAIPFTWLLHASRGRDTLNRLGF